MLFSPCFIMCWLCFKSRATGFKFCNICCGSSPYAVLLLFVGVAPRCREEFVLSVFAACALRLQRCTSRAWCEVKCFMYLLSQPWMRLFSYRVALFCVFAASSSVVCAR